MTIHEPAGWGSDGLSSFLNDCHRNSQVSFAIFKNEYEKLEEIDIVFSTILKNLHQSESWFIGFFLAKAHGAFLAASRLMLATQIAEGNACMRLCLEYSLYGYAIHFDKDLQKIWLRRGEGGEHKRKARKAFQNKELIESMKKRDNLLGDLMNRLYEYSISFGAHPTDSGVMQTAEMFRNEKNINVSIYNLTDDKNVIGGSLLQLARSGALSLSIFEIIFRKRFELLGLDTKLADIKQGI
jgi:hypothetical protein